MWRNVGAAIAIVVVAAAATAVVARGPGGGDPLPRAQAQAATLTSFGACEELAGWLGRHAEPYVTPWGLDGGHGFVAMGGAAGTTGGVAEDTADGFAPPQAAPAARAGDVPEFSGTNVQEEGVDEPDIVKTDGRRLFTVRDGRLLHVDLTGDAPRVAGTLELPVGPHGERAWEADLLLRGDRLLAVWRSWQAQDLPGVEPSVADAAMSRSFMPGRGVTHVALIDVSAAVPRLLEEAVIDGDLVSGRLHGGTARLVVRNSPVLPLVQPTDGARATQLAALQKNRELVRTLPASAWLPWVRLTDHAAAGTVSERPLVRCEDVHHPGLFPGFGSLDVVALPLDGSLGDLETTSVLTGADTVYASTERLYVTSYTWHEPQPFDESWLGEDQDGGGGAGGTVGTSGAPDVDEPAPPPAEREVAPAPLPAPATQPVTTVRFAPVRQPQFTTALHAFDLTDPSTTAYLGSGEVEGHVLNQFSLSEHGGVLRVATTVGAPWAGGSSSGVTTFQLVDGRLRQLGHVGDLGLGERIYAVRFIGDVGYVVTFRQVDPLYTIDLRDPAAPAVLGELKIPGYSAYLHPVSQTLLLGVGQDATDEGFTTGTQVSLFDVSDLTAPRQVAKSVLARGSSDAEFDHHAFLHWPATGLTVIPASVWEGPTPWHGALAYEVDVDATTLERLGTLTHLDELGARPGAPPQTDEAWMALENARITRSLVVGDRVLTLSRAGLLASTLDTLETTAWLAFDAS